MNGKETKKKKAVPKKVVKHQCSSCGAPFPLLDAMAKQYGMNWVDADIKCGPCGRPLPPITVKVEIDTTPFVRVMEKISDQLKEFQRPVNQEPKLDVGDVKIKYVPNGRDLSPEVVPPSGKVWLSTPQVVRAGEKLKYTPVEEPKPHQNVRVVAEPMQFAKVKESGWVKFWKALLAGSGE